MTTQKTSDTLETAQVSNTREIGKRFGAGAVRVVAIAAAVTQPVTQLVQTLQPKSNSIARAKHTSQSQQRSQHTFPRLQYLHAEVHSMFA